MVPRHLNRPVRCLVKYWAVVVLLEPLLPNTEMKIGNFSFGKLFRFVHGAMKSCFTRLSTTKNTEVFVSRAQFMTLSTTQLSKVTLSLR